MFVELKEMKNKEQRNKSPFEKFKPKFERYFEKGRLLKPIYDKDGLITKIDLSENNSNIYGNLVVGILALTLFILPIVLDGTYTYDSEFSKYLGIAIWIFFTLIVGSFMTISSIKKLRNSNEREFLSVNGNGIKYRNPDSKIFRNYSWGKIKQGKRTKTTI
jgi:hypothetical protein